VSNLTEPLIIKFKRLSEAAKIPTKNHSQDAGWDLYSVEDYTIYPNEIGKISTDIAISIPPGYVGIIMSRSSLGIKTVDVYGGVIDSGYTGMIKVILYNGQEYIDGANKNGAYDNNNLNIHKGDKIAQMLILPVPDVEFLEVDELDETARSEKGFGSSGR
jgi:dUTP pyrophosphatase